MDARAWPPIAVLLLPTAMAVSPTAVALTYVDADADGPAAKLPFPVEHVAVPVAGAIGYEPPPPPAAAFHDGSAPPPFEVQT
jgi:hypothetical protein